MKRQVILRLDDGRIIHLSSGDIESCEEGVTITPDDGVPWKRLA